MRTRARFVLSSFCRGTEKSLAIAGDCTTSLHARQKGVAEDLPGVDYRFWVVMEKPSARLPESAFF